MRIRRPSSIDSVVIRIAGFRVRVLVRRVPFLEAVLRGGVTLVACLMMRSVPKICSASSLAAAVWAWVVVALEVVLSVCLALHSYFPPRESLANQIRQAVVYSTAQASSLIWAEAPESAYTNSAEAHHDDDPNKQHETLMLHRPLCHKHYNPCYRCSSSSFSPYSPVSSPAPAHPQVPPSSSIQPHHTPNNVSPPVSVSNTTWTRAKSLISRRGSGKSWIRGQMRITTTS